MSSLLELKDVVHALDPIADKYFEVGVQLGLKVELLRRIAAESPSLTRCLHETIHSWQNNNSSERCTWSTLADAVARVGGHKNLARELQKRGNNAPVSSQTLQPCGEFEDSAKDTGYSTKSDWTTSSGFETATEKPCAVAKIEDLDRVDQRGNNLPPLPSESEAEDTGYSTKSDSPISDIESSSGSETERFELMPGCGCGEEKPCSLPTLCARGCPNPTRRRIPVLQKKRVGAVTQDDLLFEDEDDCEDFERKTKKIHERFGNFVTDVCCSFKKQNVNIETLTLYLQSSFPVMKTRSKELDEATSMEQVFKILVDQACSWFDYEVIVSVIEKFGESSDKDRAQMYEEEFRKYAKQRLPKGKNHIEIGSGAKVGGMQLVVKIDKEWEEVTFNELDKLLSSFASILGVRRRDLYLADVREGCIMMTFMIQEELAKKLFPTKSCLTAEQIHSFKNESVISVRCGKLIWRASTSERSEERFGRGIVDQPAKVYSQYVMSYSMRHLLTSGLSTLIVFILLGTVLAGVSLIMQSVYIPQMHTNTYPALVIQRTHVPSDHTLLIPSSIPGDVTIQLEKYSIPFYAPFREGCIMMTFMIQEKPAKQLFRTKSRLTTEQIHSLKSLSVISVRCGKLSWRSSAMTSNKTESTAMPIKPQSQAFFCTQEPFAYIHSLNSESIISDGVPIILPFPTVRKRYSSDANTHVKDKSIRERNLLDEISLMIYITLILLYSRSDCTRALMLPVVLCAAMHMSIKVCYALITVTVKICCCLLLFCGYRVVDNSHRVHQRHRDRPQFFGIYYAMGFALILEGSCYLLHKHHIYSNFQFDTMFIFITGGIILKVYWHNCHCHVRTNSFITYFTSAVNIFLTLGILQYLQCNDGSYPLIVKIFSFIFPSLFIIVPFLAHSPNRWKEFWGVQKIYYGKPWLALLLPVIIGTITKWTFMLALMIEFLTLKWKHLLKEYKLTNHFN